MRAAPADPGDGDAYAALLERIREPERDRLRGLQAGHDRPPPARPDERDRRAPTVADYAALVERDPVEYDRLVDSLLIKVTEFFRDARLWDHLRSTVLPALVAEARREATRAAHLVGRVLDRRGGVLRWPSRRRGDPQRGARAVTSASSRPTSTGPRSTFARRGVYPPARSRGVPAAAPRALLRAVRRGLRGRPSSSAPRMVFGEHDLSARVPFPRIDLLLCRNVLIYFTVPLQRVALETFAFSLRPDGRLVLGMAETVAGVAGAVC